MLRLSEVLADFPVAVNGTTLAPLPVLRGEGSMRIERSTPCPQPAAILTEHLVRACPGRPRKKPPRAAVDGANGSSPTGSAATLPAPSAAFQPRRYHGLLIAAPPAPFRPHDDAQSPPNRYGCRTERSSTSAARSWWAAGWNWKALSVISRNFAWRRVAGLAFQAQRRRDREARAARPSAEHRLYHLSPRGRRRNGPPEAAAGRSLSQP